MVVDSFKEADEGDGDDHGQDERRSQGDAAGAARGPPSEDEEKRINREKYGDTDVQDMEPPRRSVMDRAIDVVNARQNGHGADAGGEAKTDAPIEL